MVNRHIRGLFVAEFFAFGLTGMSGLTNADGRCLEIAQHFLARREYIKPYYRLCANADW